MNAQRGGVLLRTLHNASTRRSPSIAPNPFPHLRTASTRTCRSLSSQSHRPSLLTPRNGNQPSKRRRYSSEAAAPVLEEYTPWGGAHAKPTSQSRWSANETRSATENHAGNNTGEQLESDGIIVNASRSNLRDKQGRRWVKSAEEGAGAGAGAGTRPGGGGGGGVAVGVGVRIRSPAKTKTKKPRTQLRDLAVKHKDKKLELWKSQKAALEQKFGDEGWNPRKRVSPDAMDGMRALHEDDPERWSTPVLAEHFKVSPEAIRRILKSKWKPKNDEAVQKRKERWARRHDRIWDHQAELGLRPERVKDRAVEDPDAFEEDLRARQMLDNARRA